jgi:ribonucleotide monophosphatase NagD (HAD superfamily)
MKIKKIDKEIESVIFDLHGVVFGNSEVVRNAIVLINKVVSSGIKVGFLTNISTSSHR